MNYKTIMISALLAGTIHQAWGMQNQNQQYLQWQAASAPLMSPSNSILPSNNNNPLPHSNTNNNNGSVPKQEVSDTARLAAAFEQLNLTLQKGFTDLGASLDRQAEKIDDLVKVQMIMTQTLVSIYNDRKGAFAVSITKPDFSEITNKDKKK